MREVTLNKYNRPRIRPKHIYNVLISLLLPTEESSLELTHIRGSEHLDKGDGYDFFWIKFTWGTAGLPCFIC
jgi:hypothetical protein